MGQLTRRARLVLLMVASCTAAAAAQSPRPFPQTAAPPARQAPPQTPAPRPPVAPAPQTAAPETPPTETTLGFPIYPTAVFLRSFDAGRGQRYYLYGVTSPFAEMVNYYRSVLKEKGTLVFEVPPTHVFEIGRFREETMAFPPGVTVKDYTFNGTAGYPNPKAGAQPERFPTLIQIVPAAPATASPRER